MSAPALERMALLRRQRQAADRSAHCHFLARLRIMQGYFGAAKFYQHEAARWHVRACELRLECNPPRPAVTLRSFTIAEYTGPRGPIVDLSIHGSKSLHEIGRDYLWKLLA